MPKILESEALTIARSIDQAPETDRPWMLDLLDRYQQQQRDDGEPDWPSVERARMEREANLRGMFESPDKITYDPGPFSQNPQEAKMLHANMALLSARYQKEPREVAERYDFLINDYARQKLGASEDVDTAKFYALAQKDIQKTKLREDTQREGINAALRGEDGVKALAAWQAKNADRAKEDAGLFMRGYQQALEQDGEMLPIADRLLKALESGTDKTGQNVQANMDRGQVRQELGQMVEQLAGMKKGQRKSVYRAIAARIDAAGYDQKGFWSQMLGELDKGLYRMEGTLGTQAGQAADVMSNFPAMLAEGMTGNRDFGMTPAETAQTDANLARRERIGNVQEEILQIVSGELDPVRPTTGWMNETVETGLIKGPGAVAPFMAASALLGPYGAGLVFTADFAEQNRRELVQSGLNADQARKVGVMAAPLQAAVESLSNMVSLGKFPAVQAALSRFTRPVGGASLVGRYVQNSLISGATEFTEEQVQDNVVVPAMQELLGALEKDVPEVDWSFYKTRAANATPELAATLLPMALVFGGVMTAADAKLSRTMTQNVTLMMSTGMDQAQAVEVASQPTHEQRIKKGAELWLHRKGTKASMEEAQKKLADQYRTLAADSAAAVRELEARGVLPRLLPMQGGDYRLTFNDGSTADFKTREEALGGIHVYIRDRMQRSTRALRETIDTLTKNLEQGREFALEISPEAMPADEAVRRGIISPQALQERAEQGAILDATTLIENSVLTGKALGDEEAPLMLYGMSKNEWYDKEGRAIGIQRIKDDILRTTMRLWDGASPLTLIEEKTEGDAKVILSTPGKRQWMLDHLRAYEDASGDKLFTSDDNAQINDKQLIEAWSHMAQSYFVAAKDKVKGRTLGRYLRDIEEAELTAAMQGRASWWQAVVNRAQKLGELKAAGKLNEDVVAELEKQLGIDSQVKHEQGAMQEVRQVRDEVAQQVDTSGYSEETPGPNGETFALAPMSMFVTKKERDYAFGDGRYTHPVTLKNGTRISGETFDFKWSDADKMPTFFGYTKNGDEITIQAQYVMPDMVETSRDGNKSANDLRDRLAMWHSKRSRAIPADASKVAQMPDGARLVGPTTFSIRAFHGTPHKVDKFTTAKIGTGEGAQAYGWGLYFAENRDVASGYRSALGGRGNFGFPDGDSRAGIAVLLARGKQGEELARKAYGDLPGFESMLQQAKIAVDERSNLYTVELLPDADEFLDWDKPLSEQSEKVKNAIQKAKEAMGDVRDWSTWTGMNIYAAMELYSKKEFGEFRGDAVSKSLASLGIPGIRYLDEGSRNRNQWIVRHPQGGENVFSDEASARAYQKRNPEETLIPPQQTRNYVIFDENLVRILEENGKPVDTSATNSDTFSMASASGAAQANEPSPGGLSEAEAEIKTMLPTDVRADYQKFDDRAPILWRGETAFPKVRSVKIIGADSSGKSRSIYPSAAVTLANGGVFVKRFRVSDHAQVSETAFRQYDLDYRLTRERGETERAFDKRILDAAQSDLIDAAAFAWEDQMKQLRPLVDFEFGNEIKRQKAAQRREFEIAQQIDDTIRFFRDNTKRPAKVYENKFGWIYQDGILKDAQGQELGQFANLDAARFWIRDEYFNPLRASGGTQETFSLRVTPAQDAEYLAAVEAGDMEKAQRMVNEAAKAAGFTERAYHGTSRAFDVFKGYAFFFTRDRRTAEAFAELRGGNRVVEAFIKPGESYKEDFRGGSWQDMEDKLETLFSKYDSAEFENVWDRTGDTNQLIVWDSNRIKSADPVTRDDQGNVIPLSQRFNPADDRITYSLRPGDFASRVEAMFSPFQRSPEARLVMARVAKDRALRLGNELIEKANVIRTMGSIDREARVRAALAEDKAVQDYLDGLTPAARQTLEWQPADLQDDPLIAAMLDFGKLMSKTTALQRGKVDLKMGDFDGAPWLPPSFYSKGAGIMPDQMAQAMFDAGLLPDAYTDTLWAELSKRIEATRKDKAAHREAVQAFKDAKKAARDAASKEARTWADNAKKQAGSGKAQRDRIKAWLRVLDGILAASPPEVRARVGGFVKMAGIATDEAALRYLEDRVAKLDKELEKWLKKDATGSINRLFKRAAADYTAGKKAKGKLGPDEHYLFQRAEAASEIDAVALRGELAKLDALADDESLSDDQRALAVLERGIVELVGDMKNADSGRLFTAFDELTRLYSQGVVAWKAKQTARREARQAVRDALKADAGKSGVLKERQAMEKAMTTLFGKAKSAWLSVSSFSEVLRYAFGSKSQQATELIDGEREASNAYEDEQQAIADELEAFFASMAGGKTLAGERLRFDMAQRTIKAGDVELSQFEAITALLMWRQEDGRRHMEGTFDENGQRTSGWSYDQAWINEVEKQLTPEGRRFMAWLAAKYGSEHGELNALYRERHGVNLPAHDNYAPITVKPMQAKAGEIVDPVSGAAVSGSILTPGSLRTRSRMAIAEPEFRDALQTFVAHKKQMGYWKAYYDLATDVQAVLGNRELMNSVEAAAGKEAVVTLRKWMDVLAQGGVRDASAGLAMNGMFQRMMNRAATVGLLGRVSTLLVQSTQLAAASVQMPVGAYLRRFGKLLAGQLDWKGAIQSDFIQRRIQSAPPIVRQAMENLGTATRPNLITRAVRNLGNLLSGADGLFTGGTYAILLDYHRETGRKLGLTGDDLEEHAHREAERATEQVAQPTRTATRSLAELTATNPLAKVSFAYASEARQKIALLGWAAVNFKADPVRFGKAAFLVFGVGGVMSQVLKNIWKEAKGDDDEEKWSPERLVRGSVANALHGIPMVSEMMNEPGMFSSTAWAQASLDDLLKGKADMRDINTLLGTVGLFNDTAAGVAAMSNAGYDFAKIIEAAFSDASSK